jgi:hypothetical protein
MAFQLMNLRAHVPPGLKGGIPGSQKNLGKPLSALNILYVEFLKRRTTI